MTHRVFLDPSASGLDPAGLARLAPGDSLTITGDEAEHARRVKRLQPGDTVSVLTGAGVTADASVLDARRDLRLRLLRVAVVAPLRPAIDVLSATPKGPRADDMLDMLAQVGARSWAPLGTALGVVDPRETKLARLRRIAREASKQSGRAWDLDLRGPVDFDHAFAAAADQPAPTIVLAHADAPSYTRSGADSIRLLIGPEGGWTAAELDRARGAGARIARFGPHVMRIELAAAVACAILLDIERRE